MAMQALPLLLRLLHEPALPWPQVWHAWDELVLDKERKTHGDLLVELLSLCIGHAASKGVHKGKGTYELLWITQVCVHLRGQGGVLEFVPQPIAKVCALVS